MKRQMAERPWLHQLVVVVLSFEVAEVVEVEGPATGPLSAAPSAIAPERPQAALTDLAALAVDPLAALVVPEKTRTMQMPFCAAAPASAHAAAKVAQTRLVVVLVVAEEPEQPTVWVLTHSRKMKPKQCCPELDAEQPKHLVPQLTRLAVAPWAVEVPPPRQSQAELSSQ